MYKLIKNEMTGQTNYVQRMENGAHIPFDPQNTDYQQYLAWLEAGNTVLPADEPTQG